MFGGRARDAGAREVLVLDAVAARERQRRGPRRRRDGGVLRREALAVLAPGRVEHDDRRRRPADDRAPAVAVHLLDATSGPAHDRCVFGAIDDAETPATRVVDAAKGPAAAGHASNATNARAARILASSIVVTRYELAQR